MPRYDVDGKHVLITGGANGIGLSAAKLLAERGAQLSLVDYDAGAAERAAGEIGVTAEPFVADVTDRDSIAAAIVAARERFGPVDVCVASAGISGDPTPSTDVTHDQFERVIETNLLGVWRTLHGVLPDVIERKGYLLPIASLAAAVPAPLITAYGASKAGVHSISRSLRFELAHTGAKVGCGYFSVIDTNMTREAYEKPVVKRSLRQIPGALSKPAPVEKAGAALVRAIEGRKRRACHPRWVSPVLSLHGLGSNLEAIAARDPRVVRNYKKAQAEIRESAATPEPEKETTPQ